MDERKKDGGTATEQALQFMSSEEKLGRDRSKRARAEEGLIQAFLESKKRSDKLTEESIGIQREMLNVNKRKLEIAERQIAIAEKKHRIAAKQQESCERQGLRSFLIQVQHTKIGRIKRKVEDQIERQLELCFGQPEKELER